MGTNPAPAEIKQPGLPQPPQPNPPRFAVGARFIYKHWVWGPIRLSCKDGPSKRPGDKLFRFSEYGEDRADLDIDYSGPVRDDLEHEDAVKCFENLMKSLGLEWSIYFPPSLLEVTRQNDCKSAIALVKAG